MSGLRSIVQAVRPTRAVLQANPLALTWSLAVAGRGFSSTSRAAAPKSKKEQDAKKASEKRILRRQTQRRIEAKKPANLSPLFMEIPQALRYLRAAEVGRPLNEAVISIQTMVFSDRGVAPLQGSVRFPKALKETRILVLTQEETLKEQALAAGATAVGDSSTIEEIFAGKFELDFDKIIATPDIEAQLRKVARILGPRGLMPNAKRGTVTEDINGFIQSNLGTQPFREKNGFVALTVARCNFTDEEVIRNIMVTSKTIREVIAQTKSKKPITLGQTILTTTHGPGIVINF